MTVKDTLSQAYYIAKAIETKKQRLARLRNMSLTPTSTVEAIRTSGTDRRSRVETYALQAIELEEQLTADLADLIRAEQEIQRLLNLVPDARERAMLEDYHLNRMTQQEVAEKYRYDARQVRRIFRCAYQWLDEKMSYNVRF